MLAKLRNRMSSEGGFTLIELLIVLIIIAILVAIAIPSYLGFRDRANLRSAQSEVRSAVPAAEAFYSDNNTYLFSGTTSGTNSAANVTALRTVDQGLSREASFTVFGSATQYCISVEKGGNRTAKVVGPGGQVLGGPTGTATGQVAACTGPGG
jgi:type IV pilus assembly protein PilA